MEENQEQEKKLISGHDLIKFISGEYLPPLELHNHYQWNNVNNTFTIKNLISQDPITLIRIDISNNLLFENCEFKYIVAFENSSCGSKIEFRNSSIGSFLSFYNCSRLKTISITNNCVIKTISIAETPLEQLNISHDVIVDELEITNSSVNNIYLKHNCKLESITFNKCKTSHLNIFKSVSIGTVYTEFAQNEIGRVSINDICKIDSFSITSTKPISTLQIGKESTINEVILTSTEISYLALSGNSYIGNLETTQSSTLKQLLINNTSTCRSLKLWRHSTIENIHIDNAIVDAIFIQQCSISSLSFTNKTKVRTLTFNKLKNNLQSLDINDCYIQKFIYDNDRQITANITKSLIPDLQFSNTIITKDSYIQFTDININNLNIHNTFVSGTVIFNGITSINTFSGFKEINDLLLGIVAVQDENKFFQFKEYNLKSNIKIINSDFGKTQLINFNIKQFDKFEYKNSKMLEVFVADTEFPPRQNIYHPDENATQSQTLEQQRLALSQFKKIYENRGDNVRATQALAEEMEVYRLQLKKSIQFHLPNWYKFWTWQHVFTKNQEWWNNRSERINLWLNKVSSFYGNNWLRAAVVTLIVNSACFLLYARSLGFKLGNDYEMFRKLSAYSLEFLNPLRKADFLVDKFKNCTIDASATSIFIDYASRIIIAYFVYQTIAAFRKFGKKTG